MNSINPLAALKEKLMIKPNVEERERVAVVIKGVKRRNKPENIGKKASKKVKEQEEGEVSEEDEEQEQVAKLEEKTKQIGPLIVDETERGFDRNALLQKLAESKKLKVTIQPVLKISEEKKASEPIPLPASSNKVKKLQINRPLILNQDEDSDSSEGPQFITIKKKVAFEEKKEEEGEKEQEQEQEQEVIPIKVPKKKKRVTEKPEKGVAILGPETLVQFGDTDLRKRIPKKKEQVLIKTSSYFMNNREKFVDFINSLFSRYRDEIAENKDSISCDTIGKTSTNFSLLTHQKIVRDYMNIFTPYRGLLLYHGLGSGKCHAKNTPIMMSDGTTKLVQDILEGDLLMGDDSKPRKVLSLARGKDKMYKVIPLKGESYIVNQEHILCLRASGFPKLLHNTHKSNTNYNVQWIEHNNFQSKTFTFHKSKDNEEQMKEEAERFFKQIIEQPTTNDNVIEIAVKDYIKLSEKKRGLLKGYKVPIHFPEKDVPVDPYMIGYWLGDGTSYTSEITSQDSTVLYYFAKNLPKYNLFLSHRNKYTYGITGNGKYYNNVFLNTLKDLNMINNKHIPFIYKCNSRENRLKLLAGLLDSDGNLSNASFEFTQKNEQLMDDVIYLARSLGFSCYKSIKETSWTYQGEKKYGSTFRICINGAGIEEIPTQIPRKKAHPRKQIKDALVTGIEVKYVNEDEYYGFMIDENCRYVMGDFTVTHNTATSIAIAEGMKDSKRVIIMTPASLRANYIEELKKAGDLLYKRNQYWEWISTVDHPEALKTISVLLNLPQEYIRKHGGAFFINIKKPSNYDTLNDRERKVLEEQLNEMIRQKYMFINYNGLRAKKLAEMTSNFSINIFDNAVVVIDEAHNLISRIVNKLKKEKPISGEEKRKKKKEGEEKEEEEKESLFGEETPLNLATKLYYMLLRAKNARIVLLSGTPVINYPNEFAILFNILRGYIKTWKIPLVVNTRNKIDRQTLQEMLIGEKSLDYLDYSPSSKILTITRNPFGFKNKIKKDEGYKGVSNVKKDESGEVTIDTEFISDEDFERKIISILRRNDIDVVPQGIEVINRKALPDDLNTFSARYINDSDKSLKNVDALKRRILGLSSYFRSAQESLLPRYNKQLGVDYHIVRIPMSDTQFRIYEGARKQERELEKKRPKQTNTAELFEEKSSTYRIFSRLFCNYVMPDRPVPEKRKKKKDGKEEEEEEKEGASEFAQVIKDGLRIENKQDVEDDREGEIEGDEVLAILGGETYIERLNRAMKNIEEHSNDFLTPEALETYSPKFLHILENIQDPDNAGLHLVYSQFRTAEGIGIFSLVLEKNGFARFKINKTSLGTWEIDIPEVDEGKPTFALYTGTETAEEKEMLRHIYNGEWDDIPDSIGNVLKSKYRNNNMGEVIKVFMITSSGSEGINLRNTRFVHIMEPYWHPVRLEQVIGRARRICSHKDLPNALQTVEVFVYLMKFSEAQLKSDEAVELKTKDLSKAIPRVPITSDQYLYEISEIKANLTSQLTDAIKESAFDCYIYSNGKCVNFTNPTNDKFSYVPDYAEQQNDTTVKANKVALEWAAVDLTIEGVTYAARRVSDTAFDLYDLTTYKRAQEDPDIQPLKVGTYELNERGERVLKLLVT
jgi:hypothetical protein